MNSIKNGVIQFYVAIMLVAFTSCSYNADNLIGIWECKTVERMKSSSNESEASAFGKELAKSEVVSDSLIINSDMTFIKHISAFGVTSKTWGTYTITDSGKGLHLIKNDDAPGRERESVLEIKKLNTDLLIVEDKEGFQYTYQKIN